ncbi:MAG: hypothetical protein ABI427_20455 [Solirubrobacteraceae bacterium]
MSETAPVSMDDLRRLTAHMQPKVEAIRRLQMPTGYTVALQSLAISAFDSTLDAALIDLAFRARKAIREVLGDERSPAAQRDLALRLWVEDEDGHLGRALAEATVLVNDEYDTAP